MGALWQQYPLIAPYTPDDAYARAWAARSPRCGERSTPRRTSSMRRRMVMSMLAGATLLASTFFGTGVAAARAADVPAEFGTDWHDPVTAAPPVSVPEHARSCQVTL